MNLNPIIVNYDITVLKRNLVDEETFINEFSTPGKESVVLGGSLQTIQESAWRY
jgi:hypothetical protein